MMGGYMFERRGGSVLYCCIDGVWKMESECICIYLQMDLVQELAYVSIRMNERGYHHLGYIKFPIVFVLDFHRISYRF